MKLELSMKYARVRDTQALWAHELRSVFKFKNGILAQRTNSIHRIIEQQSIKPYLLLSF